MSQIETLNVEIDGRIAWVTFDHPPIGFMSRTVRWTRDE
jgi:hypothetical protein